MFEEIKRRLKGGEYLDMIERSEKGIKENREKELKNLKENQTENVFSMIWNKLFNPKQNEMMNGNKSVVANPREESSPIDVSEPEVKVSEPDVPNPTEESSPIDVSEPEVKVSEPDVPNPREELSIDSSEADAKGREGEDEAIEISEVGVRNVKNKWIT